MLPLSVPHSDSLPAAAALTLAPLQSPGVTAEGTGPRSRTLFHVSPCVHNSCVSHTAIPQPSYTPSTPNSKPLTTAVQWWVLLQPTDAARLTPSLAKDVCSVKGVTTKFVFHVRFLWIVLGFNPFHLIGLPWEHTHPISSVTRPFQHVPAARDRISNAV